MWRKNSEGELYAYLPSDPTNDAVLLKAFVPGERATTAQRVKLNDIGKANGEIEVWVNGKVVIKASEIVIRKGSNASVITGAHFQTFFGAEWDSLMEDQRAYFDNIWGGILACI